MNSSYSKKRVVKVIVPWFAASTRGKCTDHNPQPGGCGDLHHAYTTAVPAGNIDTTTSAPPKKIPTASPDIRLPYNSPDTS
jgi:hypothetical protein